MKTSITITIVIFLLINLLACNPETVISKDKEIKKSIKINWLTEISSAEKLAKKENKFIMIEFTADWCTACQQYQQETFQDMDVVNLINKQLIPLKHNMTILSDNPTDLAKIYDIKALPVIIFTNKDGKELKSAKIRGFLQPKQLIKHLKTNKLLS